MENILDYMLKSRDERKSHLVLDTPCSEIGGTGSVEYKGLLAYHLKTTIPTGLGMKVQLCHGCGNAKCSNVDHLYWGTARDNFLDMQIHGTYKSINRLIKEKYGEGAEEFLAKTQKKASAQKIKKFKPQEHWEKFRVYFNNVDFSKRGWAYSLAPTMGVSATHVKRIAEKLELIGSEALKGEAADS